MKTVQICLSCFSTIIDGVPCTDHDSITKLILLSRQDPNAVYVHKWVCPNCKKFLSEEYCEKLLNPEKERSNSRFDVNHNPNIIKHKNREGW